MGVEHSVDSEDLVHCDLMAICAFFVALLMRGLQFKQALAVVNRIGNFVSTIKSRLLSSARYPQQLEVPFSRNFREISTFFLVNVSRLNCI